MTTRKPKKPLPCPFCGAAPRVQPWHGGSKSRVMLCCDECDVAPGLTGRNRSDAVARWNRRAP